MKVLTVKRIYFRFRIIVSQATTLIPSRRERTFSGINWVLFVGTKLITIHAQLKIAVSGQKVPASLKKSSLDGENISELIVTFSFPPRLPGFMSISSRKLPLQNLGMKGYFD